MQNQKMFVDTSVSIRGLGTRKFQSLRGGYRPEVLIRCVYENSGQFTGRVKCVPALGQAKRLQNYCRRCKNDSLAATQDIRQLPVDSQ